MYALHVCCDRKRQNWVEHTERVTLLYEFLWINNNKQFQNGTLLPIICEVAPSRLSHAKLLPKSIPRYQSCIHRSSSSKKSIKVLVPGSEGFPFHSSWSCWSCIAVLPTNEESWTQTRRSSSNAQWVRTGVHVRRHISIAWFVQVYSKFKAKVQYRVPWNFQKPMHTR